MKSIEEMARKEEAETRAAFNNGERALPKGSWESRLVLAPTMWDKVNQKEVQG